MKYILLFLFFTVVNSFAQVSSVTFNLAIMTFTSDVSISASKALTLTYQLINNNTSGASTTKTQVV